MQRRPHRGASGALVIRDRFVNDHEQQTVIALPDDGDALGMILGSGPTGSGKTTTLYALLHELVSTKQCIVAVEDPDGHVLRFGAEPKSEPGYGGAYS